MQYIRYFISGMMVLMLSSCAMSSVPERLPVYFGVDKDLLSQAATPIPSSQVKAGLLVVNDTTYPDSAPPLSDEGLEAFTQRLHSALRERFPVSITKVIDSVQLKQGQNSRQFVNIAQNENLDYVMLAVLSSSEVEVPDRLSFQGGEFGGGGARGRLLGFRAENYALVELALVDGKTGHPIVHANGSAWSVLERLNVPIESNVYPVVRRDLTQPPIYPSGETAYETLRVVSANDAMKQALMHLQEVWSQESSS